MLQNIFYIAICSVLLLAVLTVDKILLPHSIGTKLQGLYHETQLASISRMLSSPCSDSHQIVSDYSDKRVNQERNAALSISPTRGVFKVGDEFFIAVLLDSPYRAMNAAEAKIMFPPDSLEVLHISTKASLFDLWVKEPTFSNEDGTIVFVGGLPNPGFLGTQGLIMEIVFRVRRGGNAKLVIRDAEILANDGFGTSIFKESRGAVYTLVSNGQKP